LGKDNSQLTESSNVTSSIYTHTQRNKGPVKKYDIKIQVLYKACNIDVKNISILQILNEVQGK